MPRSIIVAVLLQSRGYNLNPYTSPKSSTPIANDQAAESLAPFGLAFCIMIAGTSLTGVFILLQWCLLDYVTVRVLRYPEDLGIYVWAFMGTPILPLFSLSLF